MVEITNSRREILKDLYSQMEDAIKRDMEEKNLDREYYHRLYYKIMMVARDRDAAEASAKDLEIEDSNKLSFTYGYTTALDSVFYALCRLNDRIDALFDEFESEKKNESKE